jgi:hypothetical protein
VGLREGGYYEGHQHSFIQRCCAHTLTEPRADAAYLVLALVWQETRHYPASTESIGPTRADRRRRYCCRVPAAQPTPCVSFAPTHWLFLLPAIHSNDAWKASGLWRGICGISCGRNRRKQTPITAGGDS